MNAVDLWMEYSLEMAHSETISELNADEAEGNEWVACCEAIEAAEHGMTVSELRLEYATRARDGASAAYCRGLQLMSMADMANPQ